MLQSFCVQCAADVSLYSQLWFLVFYLIFLDYFQVFHGLAPRYITNLTPSRPVCSLKSLNYTGRLCTKSEFKAEGEPAEAVCCSWNNFYKHLSQDSDICSVLMAHFFFFLKSLNKGCTPYMLHFKKRTNNKITN